MLWYYSIVAHCLVLFGGLGWYSALTYVHVLIPDVWLFSDMILFVMQELFLEKGEAAGTSGILLDRE